jgi:hypothetical protein
VVLGFRGAIKGFDGNDETKGWPWTRRFKGIQWPWDDDVVQGITGCSGTLTIVMATALLGSD